MSGERRAYDETMTTTSGAVYGFRLARGNHGFSTTTNPFAAKSTQGDRSYSDYDALQAVALSDQSGGFGQERLESTNRYWNGINLDTRGGKIIIGPRAIYDAEARNLSCGSAFNVENYAEPPMLWQAVYAPSLQKVAAWFDCADDVNDISRIWLPLAVTVSAGVVTVAIYQNTPAADGIGEPAASPMASVSLPRAALRPTGSWVEVVFSTSVSVAPGSRYWISVETAGTNTEAVRWLKAPLGESVSANGKAYNGSSWSALGAHLVFWYDDSAVHPDGGLFLLVGAGEDGIRRLWGYEGRRLYYIDANGKPTPVQNGAGSVYEAIVDIMDACWFQGTGDAHPYLYVALGDATNMVKFDGNIGAEQWASISLQARALAVHDDKLWYADEINVINFSTTGSTAAGTNAFCGDKSYAVRKMISWQGYLYIGKPDGLYRASYSGTTITIQLIVDLRAQIDDNNFAILTTHQEDLIFSVGNGLMRYTPGGVIQSIAGEVGSDILLSQRGYYRSACSSVGALFALIEGPLDGYSALVAYVEGGWHPLAVARRFGDFMRSIIIDPGLYGDLPRLWYSCGTQLAYVTMPMATQKRYLSINPGYADYGIWESSWFDGNLRTIDKDWMSLELDVEHVEPDGPMVYVYYRLQEKAAWTYLGVGTTEGVLTFNFPAQSYGPKIQLRLRLESGSYGGQYDTPRVNAVVLKYLERPDVIHTHLRTYFLSPRQETRAGALVTVSVAEQIDWLRQLASEKEPLIWRAWYGSERRVHVLRYNATEQREEIGTSEDTGSVIVAVQLQEV